MAKPVKHSIAKGSLLTKGFVEDRGDHEFYFFHYKGRWTGAWTKLSRKPSGDDIAPNLFKRMRPQLQLRYDREVEALLSCEMTHQGYIDKLLEYRVITNHVKA